MRWEKWVPVAAPLPVPTSGNISGFISTESNGLEARRQGGQCEQMQQKNKMYPDFIYWFISD